jgi:hypothetical protein
LFGRSCEYLHLFLVSCSESADVTARSSQTKWIQRREFGGKEVFCSFGYFRSKSFHTMHVILNLDPSHATSRLAQRNEKEVKFVLNR